MSSGSVSASVSCQIKAIKNAVLVGLNHMVLSHVHAKEPWLFPTLSSDPCLYAACIILPLGKSISCLFCVSHSHISMHFCELSVTLTLPNEQNNTLYNAVS